LASGNGAQLGGPHHQFSADKHASALVTFKDTPAENP
jgi:hypothetical protein